MLHSSVVSHFEVELVVVELAVQMAIPFFSSRWEKKYESDYLLKSFD